MREFSKNFLEKQKAVIEARLAKYKDPKRIADELLSGDVSPYTRYKQTILTPILEKILQRMVKGGYGICEQCGGEIEMERLKYVPAAEKCMKCAGCVKKKVNATKH